MADSNADVTGFIFGMNGKGMATIGDIFKAVTKST
jgi:hypothetical protein